MPRTTQIIPEHLYPHSMVVINDNTTVTPLPAATSGSTNMLCVFASPKGHDRVMHTVEDGLAGFLEEYGQGPVSLYGQPYLNAYAAAASGAATLQCLRVSAADATYPALAIYANYLVTAKAMDIRFTAEPYTAALTDLVNLPAPAGTPTVTIDSKEYQHKPLFSVAYLGRGAWGNNLRIRVTSNTNGDKENAFKNYTFEVYTNENGMQKKEEFIGCFNEDAVVAGVPHFIEGLVNDPTKGSNLLAMHVHTENFAAIVDAYVKANPETTLTMDDFDVLLGINKYTKAQITNYTINTTAPDVVVLNSLAGVALTQGNDGKLTPGSADYATTLKTLYKEAYAGTTCVDIKSKNKYPVNLILDAGFEPDVKVSIAALAESRGDCVAIADCGTTITTKASVLTYVTTNLATNFNNRVLAIDAYAGKTRDPYNGKIVTVTSTFDLATRYPQSFKQNNNMKHVPLAGNNYGLLTGFIAGTVFPVFDEDVDSEEMDKLCEARVNFARNNVNQDVIRATQTTSQPNQSSLSELNNVFVLLDIKRDCERLASTF
ncbi:MAG: hypothetical protein RSC68_25615, partial [Acinetobacter sp.]